MNTNQITLVKDSFGLVGKLPVETVGQLFYGRLFQIAPEVRPLFRSTSIPEQSRKLIGMLSYIINKLDNLDSILEEVTKLAQRHVKYGIEEYHYEKVGEALLWTLEQGLGRNWTMAVKDAWIACYTLLSGAMIASTEFHSKVIN